MAPKKSVVKTSTPVKNTTVKEVRKIRAKKVKPEKPKLTSPTTVKYKFPSIKHLLNPVNEGAEMTPLNAAQQRCNLTKDQKLDLSNEVALAQLVKPEFLNNTPEENPPEAKTKKVKPKHVKCKESNNTRVVNTHCKATKVASKSSPGRKSRSTKKVLEVDQPEETATAVDVPVTNGGQRKGDSITTKPSTIHSKKGKTNKCVLPTNETSHKDSTIRLRRTSLRKGKKNIEELLTTDNQGSPSILEQKIETEFIKKEKHSETSKVTVVQSKTPTPVQSRKISLASDCLSWTKDISSTTTGTTCYTVSSSDFFCFDNKIPVIKLSNINHTLKKSPKLNNVDETRLSDCDANDNVSKCNSETSWSANEVVSAPVLNLSSPSASPVKSHSTSITHVESPLSATKNCCTEMIYMIDKLSSKLKKLDMEMVNWLEHKNEDAVPFIEFLESNFKIFKEECDSSRACRNIKTIFSDFANNAIVEDCPNKDSNVANDLDEPAGEFDAVNLSFRSDEDSNFISKSGSNVMLSQRSENDNISLEDAKMKSNENSEDDNFTSDKIRYTPFEQNFDDDDALSLFAESLTDLESSRIGSAAPSIGADHDEYIPQPLSKDNYADRVIYCPTKITRNEPVIHNNKTKIICKKQLADSTYRESEQSDEPIPDSAENIIEERVYETEATDVTAMCPPLHHTSTVTKQIPILMSHRYSSMNPVRSLIFKGVCFFNLISNCKKARCNFPHVQLDILEVQQRLSRFNDDIFISEYMLMRSWPCLRRKYGMCFIERCYSIGLTRILVEMAIDFIQKANANSVEDAILKMNVNEYTLTHLNIVDLNICEDLLKHNVEQNKSLCDVFMETIAATQNFARFKSVFINLSKFVIQNGGTFSLDVATLILERVSILPCEAPLAHAMISVMQNTDQSIFSYTMTRQFENQLLSMDNDLYEKFLSLKQQAFSNQPELDINSMEQETINQVQSESIRYTSPDTTKLDSMNKTVEEQTNNQTVSKNLDMLRTMIFTTQQNFSYGSNDGSEYRPPAKKQKWQENTRNIPNKFSDARYHPKPLMRPPMRPQLRPLMRPPMRPPLRAPMRPPLRPPMNNHQMDRLVFSGSTPSKYPRKSGQNFF